VFTLIKVVIGVILNPANEVLVAKRPPHQHLGDLWEFPGGKIELGESPKNALCRELYEELDITVQKAHALLKFKYLYPEKKILFDVWQVTQFFGEPKGKEGQLIRWVQKQDLEKLDFPLPNREIVKMVAG
jgi:8-oxo-dGTP diphosphatase